jgi:hypothetical protein
MKKFVIEKGVPLPDSRHGNCRYPWGEMEPGDSFFVPDGNFKSLQSTASRRDRNGGRRFAARPEAGGVRVWRTE